MGDVVLPTWSLKDTYLKEAQSKDVLCQRIFAQVVKNGEKMIHRYYVEQGILMKYVSDNKQHFEVIVVPPQLASMLLKLAHDVLGHNGTAYLYETLRTCHLDVWEVAPVVLEATVDEEEPEKGPSKDSLESSESSNVSLYCG